MKQNYAKGIQAIIISALGFAGMSFFVKLAGDLPVAEKAVFRNLIAALAAFIMLRRSGLRFEIGEGNRLDMLLRCAAGTVGLVCNFWVLGYLSMGDANILQKMAPFFSILMSALIIGEKPDRRSLLFVLAAFIGAAFVVKPGRGLASFPALIGLLGGLGAGTAYTYVRKLGNNGVKGPVIVLCFSSFSVLALLPFAIYSFRPMAPRQLGCLLLAGVCGAVGQFFVTAAYTYAPAKDISVFDYTQVLFAALLGFVFFGEIPDIYSFIGYVIIIGVAVIKWYFRN